MRRVEIALWDVIDHQDREEMSKVVDNLKNHQ
jgi:hypothetical protein